jgi:ribosomal protein L19E
VIKTTIFLRYIKDFQAVNEVYASYFSDQKPARSTVAVSALPVRALVEIEMVAYAPTAPVSEPKPKAKPAAKKKGKKKKGKGKKKK